MRTASDFFLTEQWVTFTLKTVLLSRVTWSIAPVRTVCHVLASPIEISFSIADDLAKVQCPLNGRDMDQNQTFIFSSDSKSAYRPVHAIDRMCSSASSTNYSMAS
jgi:Cdc6-like AAA superfamily ATPase